MDGNQLPLHQQILGVNLKRELCHGLSWVCRQAGPVDWGWGGGGVPACFSCCHLHQPGAHWSPNKLRGSPLPRPYLMQPWIHLSTTRERARDGHTGTKEAIRNGGSPSSRPHSSFVDLTIISHDIHFSVCLHHSPLPCELDHPLCVLQFLF